MIERTKSPPGCLGWDEIEPLREAVALLKTHPEAQPNEPLTLEELRWMDGCPVWVKARNEDDFCAPHGWTKLHRQTQCECGGARTETLWLNYEPQMTLI